MNSTVTIPFLSEEHAQIVKQVLDVDRELQPHAVKRVLEVHGNNLIAFVPLRSQDSESINLSLWHARKLSTLTIRLARLSTNALLENVDLIVHTLDEFGP